MTLVKGEARASSSPSSTTSSPASEGVPDGALSPAEVMKRATANVEHLNRNGDLLVVGEVFDPKTQSGGHLGFKLRDDGKRAGTSLPCFLYFNQVQRLRFALAAGLRVLARGKITVTPWGAVQFVVNQIDLVGAGAFEAAFQAMKLKLEGEGLFRPERKRALPQLPRVVGLVTSTAGEAVKDTLKRLRERMPRLHVIVAPTRVQGDEAVADIADAIRRLDASGRCDVILIVRGGGSLSDLWAFNTEPVARAIANARTPCVTGIGHEGDITIADLVADARASTPTHAAVLAVPDERELRAFLNERERRATQALRARLQRAHLRVARAKEKVSHARRVVIEPRRRVERVRERMRILMEQRMTERRQRVHTVALRLERRAPARVLETTRARLQALVERLTPPVERKRARAGHALAVLAARLHAISPLAVLGRGYALVTTEDGAVVRRADQVEAGQELDVRLEDGTLRVRVEG